MELLTERGQVRSVLRRHRADYSFRAYKFADGRTVGEVQASLAKLDVETATAADVAAVIGNESWVAPQTCHECGVRTWNAVQLGEDPDHDSSTATVCVDCLRAALSLFASTGEQQ